MMRITYLRLKNFAGIYSALSKDELELKLDGTNRITLIIGRNGGGKTTILSTLHPFAYPGNMDNRNTASLILKDKKGLKEIHYIKDDNEIEIKHVYTSTSTGTTVKSFITVNGEEKNPNGNIKSFHEMVSLYLDIEPDFLKLSRIGSNVSGLIQMKSADRKKFMSNILSDVDVYTDFYKKINKDCMTLNTTMKNLSDNIAKLNISDENDAIKSLENLKNVLTSYNNNKSDVTSHIGKLKYQCDTDRDRDLYTTASKLNKELEENLSKLKSFENNKYASTVEGYTHDDINKELSDLEVNRIELNTKIVMLLDTLNTLYERKEFLDFNASEESKITDMINLKNKLQKVIGETEKTLLEPRLGLDKHKLFRLIDIIDDCIKLFSDGIAHVSPQWVNKTLDVVLSNKNIEQYILNKVSIIDNTISDIEADIKKNSNIFVTDNTTEVLFDLHDDCDKCPYKNKINSPKDTSKLTELNNKKNRLLLERDNYLNMKVTYVFITSIQKTINDNSDLIKSLPISIEKILNGCVFNNEKTMIYDDITIIENIEELEKIKNEARNLELKISEQQILNTGSSSELKTIMDDISKNELEYNSNKDILDDIIKKIGIISNIKDAFDNLMIIEQEYDTVKETIGKLEIELESVRSDILKYDINKSELTEFMHMLNKINMKIDNTQEEIDKLSFRIQSYKNFTEQISKVQSEFDELNILREALSSQKGIPLLFMKLYLKNVTKIVNDTISKVFSDSIELQDFNLDEDGFRMPYIKNGLSIPDIIYASQGEVSLISIALSFALMEQSLKSYNVLLLDEIDATLDEYNRRLFLPILNERLDVFGCEQVFMISHNNAFDNCPVDIIMTTDTEINNFKNIGKIIKL